MNDMCEGASDKVRCEEALADIYLLLDRECSPERDAALRAHIDDCPPCLEEYGIDEHIKRLLARKCGGEQAPDGLKDRLRHQIRTLVLEQAEVTVESGPGGTTVEVRTTRLESRG